MADIVISLDLSFHCSGIAILNHKEKTVSIGILPSNIYGFDAKAEPKMFKSNINMIRLQAKLFRSLAMYRHFDTQLLYECIPYGFKRGKTNSDLDLHGMQSFIANTFGITLKTIPIPVMPRTHKRQGKQAEKPAHQWINDVIKHYPWQKHSAIISLLNAYPWVIHWFKKIDDVADAFAILNMHHKHCFPEYTIKKLIII